MSEKQSGKTGAGKKNSPASASAKSPGPMDVGLLEKIVKLMQTNDLSVVDLRDGERRVVLKRGAEAVVYNAPSPAASKSAPAAAPAAPASEVVDESAGMLQIKSPMVGTFYVAPSPDAPAFVHVGSRVNDETDVCVIEVMKVFNNVKAECSGTIAKVMVTNGQVVEFGQVLFLVKP